MTAGLFCLALLAAGVGPPGEPAAPGVSVAAARAPETTDDNPYQERFARARARLLAERSRPEAIAALFAVAALRDELGDEPVAAALRALVEDRAAHPLLAAQAAHELARIEGERGDPAGAARRRMALGLFDRAWVLGPFDTQGRGGIDTVFAPEAPVSPAAAKNARGPQGLDPPRDQRRYSGKDHEVAWRRAEGVAREGALVLDALLRPDQDAAAYVLVYLHSARAGRFALRLGSPGPLRLWLNGRPIGARDVVRPPRFDQDAWPVDLRAGENVLVIKTVVTDGAWRLFGRVSGLDGRPAGGISATLDGRTVIPLGPFSPALLTRLERQRTAGAPAQLDGMLRTRVMKLSGTDGVRAQLDRVAYLEQVAPGDREENAVEAAARAAFDAGGDTLFEAALALGRVGHEANLRRTALRVALTRAPSEAERCLVNNALGQLALAADREEEALALWRQALASHSGCWPAELALASHERDAGLPALSLRRLEALAKRFQLPAVTRALRRAVQESGRLARADELAAAWLAAHPIDTEALLARAGAARDRGDLAASAGFLTRAIAIRPELTYWAIELARTHRGANDPARAATVLHEALVIAPDAAPLHEALGRLLSRQGDRQGAIAALARVLVLQPQSLAVRRQLERLRADEAGTRPDEMGADLAREHALDGEAIARAALAAGTARAPDPSEVLLDRRVVRVHGNGLSDVFAQRLVLVRTDRGARANQEFFVRYTPGDQEVEINVARIHRRNATGEIEISHAVGRDDRDLSEPWYGMYFDNRADVVTFETLRAGDVLELQYTLSDVAVRNDMADYFGDLQFIADTVPVRRWDYILIAPRARPLYFHTPELAGFSHTTTRDNDTVIHRLGARDVAKVVAEPSMPGWAEMTPYLHVSTYRTWDEVGRWYWNLVAEPLTADESVRAAAVTAVQGAATALDKVRAVHAFVIKQTRYVGLEFGIHGFKPYRVSQVLARRFGDCKDKASLLVAMLKEVGIPAQLVILRTRRGGRIDPAPASLAVFDHAIAYVPELDLYLDGTAEFSGMLELPSQDQGTMALVIGKDGARLIETPVLPSDHNLAQRIWNARLLSDGAGTVDEVVTVVGQAAPAWRQHYQTPGQWQERYDKVWNDRFPGAKVEAVRIAGTEDPNQPVVATARISVPQLGAIENDQMTVPVSARPSEFVRSYARLSKRRHPLELAFPWRHEETLRYVLPEGWEIARLPPPRQEQSPLGTFTLSVVAGSDGRSVEVTSRLDVPGMRLSQDDYPDFRRLLGGVDLALSEDIVLKRSGR